MSEVILFAASRDQRRYFERLAEALGGNGRVVWYKMLRFPTLRGLMDGLHMFAPLMAQVRILQRRKSATSRGERHSRFFWKAFEFWYLVRAFWLYAIYYGWLSRQKEGWLGVWNGKKFRQAILVIAAERLGKKLLYFETGPLPGYSSLDCRGVNAWSSIPRHAGFYRARCSEPLSDERNHAPQIPAGLPERYVLVPFQVVEDSNIYLHSPHVRNMRQLYEWLVSLAECHSDWHFVCTPHPACSERYDDLKGRHERVLLVDDQPTSTLVSGAQAVVTINSTIGIEAIEKGVPVVVLGDANFAVENLVRTAQDPCSLEQALEDVLSGRWRADEQVRCGFLRYLRESYALPGDAMKNPDDTHITAVVRRLRAIQQQGCDKALGL